jgi:hypothetical protein
VSPSSGLQEQAIRQVSQVLGAIIAAGLGGLSGLLAVLAPHVPVLGWLIPAPLVAAVSLSSPVAAGVAGGRPLQRARPRLPVLGWGDALWSG